jgi:hypothetical protein
MTEPMVAFCNFATAPKNCYTIFSASCNYLKNVIKGRLHYLIKILISCYYFVLIKDLLHLVNFISMFCHMMQMSYAFVLHSFTS